VEGKGIRRKAKDEKNRHTVQGQKRLFGFKLDNIIGLAP
jgi:hypothetical protein